MKSQFLVPPLNPSPVPSPGYFAFFGSGNSVIAMDGNGYVQTVMFGGNAIPNFAGTAYTLTKEDNGRVINCTSASAVTITVPATLPPGFNCGLIQSGAGTVTVAGSGVTVNSVDALLSLSAQHASASLVRKADGSFNLSGALA